MQEIRLQPRSYGKKARLVQRVVALIVLTLVSAVGLSGVALAQNAPVKIVAFGDSLTAGYGLPGPDAFPAKLAAALKAKGETIEIANAGVSGDTTTGGLERVDWSVPDGTEAVILALGANDLLRGIDPAVTEKALDGILAKLKERNIKVLLAGMLAGKNMGADYETRYNAIFPALAKKYDVLFYPFFLDGVATDRALNQQDGIHPNAAGVDVIVKRILPTVEELIAQVRSNPSRAAKKT
ncbi:MAG: arylesterase [Rhizobiales bacterium]|nr:arylesterase [Hyphomicrobiales bacterium]